MTKRKPHYQIPGEVFIHYGAAPGPFHTVGLRPPTIAKLRELVDDARRQGDSFTVQIGDDVMPPAKALRLLRADKPRKKESLAAWKERTGR